MIVDAHQHFWNLEREPHAVDDGRSTRVDRARPSSPPISAAARRARASTRRCSSRRPAPTPTPTAMFEHAARARVDRRRDRVGRPRSRRTRRAARLDELGGAADAARHPPPDPRRAPTRTGSSATTVLESLALLEERELILELPCVFPRHLGDVPELAARFPGLTIVIDHLGKPPLGTRRDGRLGRRSCAPPPRTPNVAAKISGLNTMLAVARLGRRPTCATPVEVAVRLLRPGSAPVRQRLAGRAAQRRLRAGVARDRPRRRRRRAGRRRAAPRRERARASTGSTPRRVPRAQEAAMAALTDQAIAKIKDLIMSGEFAAGSKLPKEQELAQRLGLSRNSLREAVRALTLIGVLEPRVGDGTYVTSLEPELLLTGMGFVSDLLTGSTLLELHQVRRILEPVATGMAATRLDRGRLRRARGLPRGDGRRRDDAGVHRRRRGVPPDHRHGVGQRDARLADPEPLRRDAPSAPLALGHASRTRSRRRSGATGTSTTRCATATPSARAPPT